MADCNGIDAALRRLEGKIDGLQGRLNGLERDLNKCCKSRNQDNNNNDLASRVARLESYCNSIENLFGQLMQSINRIKDIFL